MSVREVAIEAIFMHDPLGFLSSGGSAHVENEGLFHAQKGSVRSAVYLSVFPSGFPVPGFGCSIGPQASRVLSISETEEIPLPLSHLRYICNLLAFKSW